MSARAALACLLMAAAAACQAGRVVTYPSPNPNDHAYRQALPDRYRVALLQAALARAGKGYELRAATVRMPQGRMVEELRHGRDVDVMWTMTTPERERANAAIRVPLYKGLIGWRLLLVRAADLPKFAAVRSLDDLKKLVALQGHDWPDTDILRANGLRVVTGANYELLFSMLAKRRGDYFPRGATEIWNEADAYRGLDIVVEPTIALHYLAASYFFVNASDHELAEDLRKGLEAMVADGSFDRIFHRYHDEALQAANLKGRRVFELANPLLPAETPLRRQELWYKP
jgi:hypothetical protein